MSNVKEIANNIIDLQQTAESLDDKLRPYCIGLSGIGFNSIKNVIYVYTSKKLLKETKEFIKLAYLKLNKPYKLEIKYLGLPKGVAK